MRMASTSTSSSLVIRLTDRDDDNRLLDLATCEASGSIGSLEISSFGPVYESHGYNIRLLSKEPIESEVIGLSVNGDDVSSAALIRSIPRDNEGYEYQYVLNLIKDGEPQRGKEYLFSLTYGFARIELVIPGVGSFLTLDVPCVCSDEISTSSVQRMLERLLDTSDDTVASWMYAGGRNDPSRYAIIEGGLHSWHFEVPVILHPACPRCTGRIRVMAVVLPHERTLHRYQGHETRLRVQCAHDGSG